VKYDLTSIGWKNKWNIGMLQNMHYRPAEGNFCDENGHCEASSYTRLYNRHMGYVHTSDCMTVIPLADAHGNS
jgi:hypothetical protein